MTATAAVAMIVMGVPATQTVSGTVSYRDKSALPPDATVTVLLEDVSRADVAAPVLATWSAKTGGAQVPIKFTLQYLEQAAQGAVRLHVRATIAVEDRVMYRTTRAYEVVTNGDRNVNLLLDREPRHSVQVQNTTWQLESLNGRAVDTDRATLLLDSATAQIRGNGGVNSFGGTYSIGDGRLKFSLGAMTLMAGPAEAMATESAFLDALRRADGYRFDGDSLVLLERGEPLAKFRALPAD